MDALFLGKDALFGKKDATEGITFNTLVTDNPPIRTSSATTYASAASVSGGSR